MTNEENIKPIPFALLIPLATVILYCYSYAFEVGYSAYFGYPFGFITMSFDLILNVVTLLFIYILIFAAFLQLNLQSWVCTVNSKYAFVLVSLIFFIVLIISRAYSPKYINLPLLISPIIAAIGIYLMNRKRSRKSGKKEGGAKIPMSYDVRSNIDEKSIAHVIVNKLGFDPLLVFSLLIVILPFIFAAAGMAEAHTKKRFFIFEQSGDNYAALRILNSQVIAARLDSTGEKFYQEFIVRSASDLSQLKLKSIPQFDVSKEEPE